MKRNRRKYAACLRRIDALERELFPEWYRRQVVLSHKRSLEQMLHYGARQYVQIVKSPYTPA